MLEINLQNFSIKNEAPILLNISEAKKYEISTSKENKIALFLVFSGLLNHWNGNILFNKINIKFDKYVRKFLQKNILFLTKKRILFEDLTVKENIKIFSILWQNFDISDAVISSFSLNDIQNIKIKNLSEEQKNMIHLSKMASCPSFFWLIDKTIFSQSFSNKNLQIIDNIINIRIKQNGSILII